MVKSEFPSLHRLQMGSSQTSTRITDRLQSSTPASLTWGIFMKVRVKLGNIWWISLAQGASCTLVTFQTTDGASTLSASRWRTAIIPPWAYSRSSRLWLLNNWFHPTATVESRWPSTWTQRSGLSPSHHKYARRNIYSFPTFGLKSWNIHQEEWL